MEGDGTSSVFSQIHEHQWTTNLFEAAEWIIMELWVARHCSQNESSIFLVLHKVRVSFYPQYAQRPTIHNLALTGSDKSTEHAVPTCCYAVLNKISHLIYTTQWSHIWRAS